MQPHVTSLHHHLLKVAEDFVTIMNNIQWMLFIMVTKSSATSRRSRCHGKHDVTVTGDPDSSFSFSYSLICWMIFSPSVGFHSIPVCSIHFHTFTGTSLNILVWSVVLVYISLVSLRWALSSFSCRTQVVDIASNTSGLGVPSPFPLKDYFLFEVKPLKTCVDHTTAKSSTSEPLTRPSRLSPCGRFVIPLSQCDSGSKPHATVVTVMRAIQPISHCFPSIFRLMLWPRTPFLGQPPRFIF
jgi:hypothetical protein